MESKARQKKGNAARGKKNSNRAGAKRRPSPDCTSQEPATKKSALLDVQKSSDNDEQISMDADFEKWLHSQELTIDDLLAKSVKIGRLTATKQYQAKINELTSLVKEFRSAAKFLAAEKTRLLAELETVTYKAETLEQEFSLQKTESGNRINELNLQIAKIEAKLTEAQSYSESLHIYSTTLQNNLKEVIDKLSAAESAKLEIMEECIVAKSKNEALTETHQEREKQHKQALDLLQSRLDVLEVAKEQDRETIADLKVELARKVKEMSLVTSEASKWKETAETYREKTGKSAEEMEKIECTKAALEDQYSMQTEELEKLRREIAVCTTQKKLSTDQMRTKDNKIAELQIELESREAKIVELEEELHSAEEERKRLHNTIQELKGNIRVFCRVRPLKEGEEGCEPGTENSIIRYPAKSGADHSRADLSLLSPPGPQQPFQEMHFTFDHVFHPQENQEAVFKEISQLLQSALDGYKVCIFAYGQTGSGKTYTMVGDKDCPGMISRSMDQVFVSCKVLEERGWKFAMHASMIEIYNEEYHDLLGTTASANKKRTVSHDSNGNTTISDVTLVNVREPGKIDQLLEKALQKRAVGATLLNDQSSRSHFVFALKIEGRNADSGQKLQGVLNLIDLAGSERVKESGAVGVRLKEAQNINKSLSALGDVIVALSNKADHIPYRNSKLTWLLQPSLGKESKTLMFVNISPSAEHCHESLCSLRFAAKVNACEIGIAKRNVMQQISNGKN